MDILNKLLVFLSHGWVFALLMILSLYFYIPKISGALHPVITNGFVSSVSHSLDSEQTPVLSMSLVFEKTRNCTLYDRTQWFAITKTGEVVPISRGTRNLAPADGGVGVITRGPWDFYGVPSSTVAIKAQTSHNCYGNFFPPVEGEVVFPIPVDQDRIGISWQRN